MSTMDTLIKMVNDIVEGLGNCKHIALIFCELSKAFDRVDHNVFLQKNGEK